MSIINLTDYQPSERFDGEPWTKARIEGASAATGPWTAIDEITFADPDDDPANPATRNFTVAVGAETWFRVIFIDGDANEEATDPASGQRRAFATVEDVETRMARDLDDAEQALADYVIVNVTGQILDACGQTVAWMLALEPIPATLSALCVEKAVGAISNPNNLAVASEQLGSYQHSETYPRSLDQGIFLSREEQAAARRAAKIASSANATMETILEARLGGEWGVLSEWVINLPEPETALGDG